MPVSYYAGAYWSARPESAESCARRSATLIRTLEQCDSVLTGWFAEAETYEEMLQNPVTPDYEGFLRLARLAEKENQDSEDDGDDLVVAVYTRHEDEEQGGSVLISCGDTSGVITNRCLVGLPALEGNPDGERITKVSVMMNLLRGLVVAWEPTLAVVSPDDLNEQLRKKGDRRFPLGWLTYVSQERGKVPKLPDPARVESFAGAGTLIQLTPERLDASNPEHLRVARQVQELLDAKELLRPMDRLPGQR